MFRIHVQGLGVDKGESSHFPAGYERDKLSFLRRTKSLDPRVTRLLREPTPPPPPPPHKKKKKQNKD